MQTRSKVSGLPAPEHSEGHEIAKVRGKRTESAPQNKKKRKKDSEKTTAKKVEPPTHLPTLDPVAPWGGTPTEYLDAQFFSTSFFCVFLKNIPIFPG